MHLTEAGRSALHVHINSRITYTISRISRIRFQPRHPLHNSLCITEPMESVVGGLLRK